MKDQASYSQTKGLQILQVVIEAYGPIFTLDEVCRLSETQSQSAKQIRETLSALARGGWIARLKRGLYVVQSPLFAEKLHPFALADALVEPAAISHWSALAHHGLTTQIPTMVQASTPQKVVTPEMRKGAAYRPRGRSVWSVLGVEIEFISVQQKHFYGFMQEWVSSWHRVKITDKERTCLDMITRPDIFGGIRFAIETLEMHVAAMDVDQLVAYALRYDVGSVIKRTGWILEAIGVQKRLLEPLREYPVQNYYPLDTQQTWRGTPDTRWRIMQNLAGGESNDGS
jgi:predicted transcriptional regulator of viral defense system